MVLQNNLARKLHMARRQAWWSEDREAELNAILGDAEESTSALGLHS